MNSDDLKDEFMKNFIRISLFAAILLIIMKIFKLEVPIPAASMPHWLHNLDRDLALRFNKPQNAHFLLSILTGVKKGLSPKLITDLKILNLGFLLSPSGLHLGGLLYFIKGKKRFPIYLVCWLIPGFFSLKRIALLKFLTSTKKTKYQFAITFIVSFLCGHFFKSPLGFIYSFLFIGTFYSIGKFSLLKIFLGLSASHLLINIFQGNEFSFVALFFSIILVQVFCLLFPICLIFLFSFYIHQSAWIEILIRSFIKLIHLGAKYSNGTFITSTTMILLFIWILLLQQKKKWLAITLILHTGNVNTPLLYSPGQYAQSQTRLEHKSI